VTRDLQVDTINFFDEFVTAFATFDGKVVAQRYFSNFIAVHTDGTLEHFKSVSEIAGYFQKYLDEYYASGCRTCTYKALECVPVGQACALATVTWELYNSAGDVVSSWRESYNLSYSESRLRVFASIDHAD
jgi:hypothetical protein